MLIIDIFSFRPLTLHGAGGHSLDHLLLKRDMHDHYGDNGKQQSCAQQTVIRGILSLQVVDTISMPLYVVCRYIVSNIKLNVNS